VKQQGGEAKSHPGSKAQVTETVVERKLEAGERTSNFITAIAIQPAHHSDEAGAEVIAKAQTSLGLELPPVIDVDGAYVSASKLLEAANGCTTELLVRESAAPSALERKARRSLPLPGVQPFCRGASQEESNNAEGESPSSLT